MIGLREGGVDVTETQFLMVIEIVVIEGIVGILVVDHRRFWLQRLLDIKHVRQRLVLNCDGIHCSARLQISFGNHSHDCFAHIGDLLFLQQRLVIATKTDERQQRIDVMRHISGFHNRTTPGIVSAPLRLMERMRA